MDVHLHSSSLKLSDFS